MGSLRKDFPICSSFIYPAAWLTGKQAGRKHWFPASLPTSQSTVWVGWGVAGNKHCLRLGKPNSLNDHHRFSGNFMCLVTQILTKAFLLLTSVDQSPCVSPKLSPSTIPIWENFGWSGPIGSSWELWGKGPRQSPVLGHHSIASTARVSRDHQTTFCRTIDICVLIWLILWEGFREMSKWLCNQRASHPPNLGGPAQTDAWRMATSEYVFLQPKSAELLMTPLASAWERAALAK